MKRYRYMPESNRMPDLHNIPKKPQLDAWDEPAVCRQHESAWVPAYSSVLLLATLPSCKDASHLGGVLVMRHEITLFAVLPIEAVIVSPVDVDTLLSCTAFQPSCSSYVLPFEEMPWPAPDGTSCCCPLGQVICPDVPCTASPY